MLLRILPNQLLMLIGLAIALSLAGISHASSRASTTERGIHYQITSISDDHGGHRHAPVSGCKDQRDGDLSFDQECCSDFCPSLAVLLGASSRHTAVLPAKHELKNDRGLNGQSPTLHRPPNI